MDTIEVTLDIIKGWTNDKKVMDISQPIHKK
jgi:hypothetical protein